MRQTSLGFTLVELMVTVAIIAIVAGLAVPSFISIMQQNRSTNFANELAASLNLARSEAIKRAATVTVCTSNTTAASPVCDSTRAWKDGWLVFVDKGVIGTFDNATDTQLKVGKPANTDTAVTAATTSANYVSYLPSGLSLGNGSQSFSICVGTVTGQSVPRTISINTTGRISITKLSSTGSSTC